MEEESALVSMLSELWSREGVEPRIKLIELCGGWLAMLCARNQCSG